MHTNLWRVLALMASVLFALVVCESGARVVEARRDDRPLNHRRIEDPILGHRMPAGQFGHDTNGFRNDSVPETADVVVLGDSQSWGLNVSRTGAWPQQLAQILGRSVYNMGMVGYGPAQFWALAPQALRLAPRELIVQLYLGNDFYDALKVSYTLSHYEAFRRVGLGAMSDRVTATGREEGERLGGVQEPIWARSALWRLLFSWRAQHAEYERVAAIARTTPDMLTTSGPARTSLSLAAPHARIDLSDPAIAEGARLTLAYLDAIHAMAGRRLSVVIVPMKVAVYEPVHPVYEAETKARRMILDWCANRSIACVDPTPKFRSAVERGEPVFPVSVDTHPNRFGYRLIAESVGRAFHERR